MRPTEVQFADEKTKKAFNEMNEYSLKNFIERAFLDIRNNPFCGIQIPKKLIPREYLLKYNVKNLWKYNLPNAWRLIYSVQGGELIIFAIILEWMDHKTYERRFNY